MLRESLEEGQLWLHKVNREKLRKNHPLYCLFWEATLNCNFFCAHCGSSAGRQKCLNELTSEEILKTFKEISRRYNPSKILIAVTGGEPLLRNDLTDIMKKAKELGFSWGLVTNGYLLNKEIVNKLKESGLSTATISIDGIGKTHDDFRKMPGSYERAIEGIKMLADCKFLNHLQITTTISKNNIHQMEDMYNIFSKLPINSWRLMNIDPIGRGDINKELLLGKNDFKLLLDFISHKRQQKGLKVTYSCSGYLGEYEKKVRDNYFNCLTGITVGSILHNGDIFVCPNVPRSPNLIQGNIRKDNFVDIWENKFKIFRERNRTSCDHCSKCNNWDNCLGNGYHIWDQEKKEPKFCHLEKLQIN